MPFYGDRRSVRKLLHMSGYQGHGSVAHPHGILITWAAIMEGGFQVNTSGARFSDESLGYSEQAAVVLAQPDGIAFDIFDERIAAIARQFEDFRQAEASGAVIEAPTVEQLAERLNLPAAALAQSFAEVEQAKQAGAQRPFRAILRKCGAIVAAIQGGQSHRHIVSHPRRCCGRRTGARDELQGTRLPNLFAAGGAAAGISGSHASGYLSGNGLLTATVLGRIAGLSAAALVK